MPVQEHAVTLHKFPTNRVTALVIRAPKRLSVLVLLLDSVDELVALFALERAKLQLWLNLSGARDCTVNADEFTQLEAL